MTSVRSRLGEPLPNDTMNGTTERTDTQKLTISTMGKQDYTNANMWWRMFVEDDKGPRLINNDKQ